MAHFLLLLPWSLLLSPHCLAPPDSRSLWGSVTGIFWQLSLTLFLLFRVLIDVRPKTYPELKLSGRRTFNHQTNVFVFCLGDRCLPFHIFLKKGRDFYFLFHRLRFVQNLQIWTQHQPFDQSGSLPPSVLWRALCSLLFNFPSCPGVCSQVISSLKTIVLSCSTQFPIMPCSSWSGCVIITDNSHIQCNSMCDNTDIQCKVVCKETKA